MLTPDVAADLMGECLRVVMLLVAVLVVPGLVVGLLVSLFQSATQINEQTLSFIPKLIAMSLVLVVAGPWMLHTLVQYTQQLIENLPASAR